MHFFLCVAVVIDIVVAARLYSRCHRPSLYVVPLTRAVDAVDIDVVAVVVDSDVPSLRHCCRFQEFL